MAFRRRPDGVYLDVPALRRIIPYLLRTRTGSTVYFPQRIEVEGLLAVARGGQRRPARTHEHLTLFHVLLTAIARARCGCAPRSTASSPADAPTSTGTSASRSSSRRRWTTRPPRPRSGWSSPGSSRVEEVRDLVNAAVRAGTTHGPRRRRPARRLLRLAGPARCSNSISRTIASLDYHNALPGRSSTPSRCTRASTSSTPARSASTPPSTTSTSTGRRASSSPSAASARRPSSTSTGRSSRATASTSSTRSTNGPRTGSTSPARPRSSGGSSPTPRLLQRPEVTVDEILDGWPHPG